METLWFKVGRAIASLLSLDIRGPVPVSINLRVNSSTIIGFCIGVFLISTSWWWKGAAIVGWLAAVALNVIHVMAREKRDEEAEPSSKWDTAVSPQRNL